MSLKKWAIKPGELKTLDRAGLLLFAARCAVRAEPWWPGEVAGLAREHVDLLVASALGAALCEADVRAGLRRLSDAGATASNAFERTDEARGQCHNYSMCALVQAVEAATAGERSVMVKRVIDTAKLVGSIAAVWGHAGRVTEATTQDAVEVAATTTWTAMRADIASIATHAQEIARSPVPVSALRAAGDLWPDHVPSWAGPP